MKTISLMKATPLTQQKLELSTVSRLLINIYENPGEVKYHSIRKSNHSIQQKLVSDHSFSLLKHAGFQEDADSMTYSNSIHTELVLGLVESAVAAVDLKLEEEYKKEQLDALTETFHSRCEGSSASRCREDLLEICSVLDSIAQHPGRWKHKQLNTSTCKILRENPCSLKLLECAGFVDDGNSVTFKDCSPEHLKHVSDFALRIIRLCNEGTPLPDSSSCQDFTEAEETHLETPVDQSESIREIVAHYEKLLEGSYAQRCRDDLQSIKSIVDGIKRNPDRFKNKPLNRSSQNGLQHSQLNLDFLRFAGFAVDDQGCLTFRDSDSLETASCLIENLLTEEVEETQNEFSHAADSSRCQDFTEAEETDLETPVDQSESIREIVAHYEKLLEGSYAQRCRDDLQSIKSIVDGIKRNPDRFKNKPLNRSSQNGLQHSQLNLDFLRFAGFAVDDQGCLTFRNSDSLETASCLIENLLTEEVEETQNEFSHAADSSSDRNVQKGPTLRRVLLHTIRFTQSSVASNFRDGQPLEALVEKLRNGMSTDDLPPIRVVEQMGLLWSLDNRRLHCMKEAFPERRHRDKTILVQMETCSKATVRREFLSKFTTGTDIVKRCPPGNSRPKAKSKGGR